MSEIRINYDELRSAASTLDQAAQEVESSNQKVESVIGQIQGTWVGDTEDAFLQELETSRPHMKQVPEIYHQMSQALRTTADRIEAAEAEAAQTIHSTVMADNQ